MRKKKWSRNSTSLAPSNQNNADPTTKKIKEEKERERRERKKREREREKEEKREKREKERKRGSDVVKEWKREKKPQFALLPC